MVDEALALRLIADDARLAARARGKAGVPAIAPDQRYAGDADYDDADTADTVEG